jgi:DNA-binding NtrC family response regulator
MIAQGSCCAAVVDYNVRAGFGLSFYEQVRRGNPQLLYVLMSAELRVALSDPQFRFLRKPFQADELSSLFRSLSCSG